MRPNPSAAGPVTPRRRAATLAVVLLLAGSPAVAQPAAAGTEPADRAAEIDAIFSWAAPDAPGCAVAVAREGKVVLERTHGLADLERGTPIGPDTLFDAGSVVKQFVAAAVLLLVDEGRLSLDGDIRAPPGTARLRAQGHDRSPPDPHERPPRLDRAADVLG